MKTFLTSRLFSGALLALAFVVMLETQHKVAAAADPETATLLNKAMEDAGRKQQSLQADAALAEMNGDDEEWSDAQQQEYQKLLLDIARQQQELEEQARQEMERAGGKTAP